MNKRLTHRIVANTKCDYATCNDICRFFTENVTQFYLLSFLLTASSDKAEQCFAGGLDDCVNGVAVFQGWVDGWARRVIVRRAIRMIQPQPGDAAPRRWAVRSEDEDSVARCGLQEAQFAGVLALKDFERFAFVLSVLEGYPDGSCAALLGTSRQKVGEARLRALQHLAGICSSQVACLS
ncbi:MAG: hypothetical protein WBG54_11555 [Acidobacteriaceae bacterium]